MKVLQKLNTSAGVVTCAEISARDDPALVSKWLTVRKLLWTRKYKDDKTGVDQYDTRSRYIALLEGDGDEQMVVGGCRIIYGRNGDELPIGECATIPIHGVAVEISRFFLTPDLGRMSCEDTRALLEMLVWCVDVLLVEEGHWCAYATIRSSLFNRLLDIGVPMARIGPPQQHEGKFFYPSRLASRARQLAHTPARIGLAAVAAA